MSVFNFVRSPLLEALGQVVQHANVIQETNEKISRTVQIISGAWIGGDEEAFREETMTRLVPMFVDYFNALAGINTNTSKAAGIMDGADSKAKGVVGKLKGTFQGI